MHRRLLALALVASLSLLAACSGGSDDNTTGATGYVALGDSYVSGPGITAQDPETPFCVRSDHNYPSLVAQTMPAVPFTDVSCGGEDTTMLEDGRTLGDGTVVEPQLSAIGKDASLVTIGIGGNDGAASAGLFNYCLLPATATDAQCTTFVTDYMPKVFPQIRANVDRVVAEVNDRAPKARIILTGYLTIAPRSGRCDVLPVSDTIRSLVNDYEDTMNDTIQKAADEANVEYVDVRSISRDHDACAGDKAWVNGVVDGGTNGAFLHPTASGMRAVADEVLKLIDD